MKIIIGLLLCTITLQISAQKVNVKEVKNADIVYLLNNLDKRYSWDNKNDLYLNVYFINDPSGSADNESCEITNSIYIATSEDGEAPEQHLFRLTSVYAPKFIKWVKGKTPQFVFTYGPALHRKTAVVNISLKSIKIIKS